MSKKISLPQAKFQARWFETISVRANGFRPSVLVCDHGGAGKELVFTMVGNRIVATGYAGYAVYRFTDLVDVPFLDKYLDKQVLLHRALAQSDCDTTSAHMRVRTHFTGIRKAIDHLMGRDVCAAAA